MKKLLLIFITSLSLFAGNYVADKPHTNINFEVKHIGISFVTGVFNDFKGTYSYDEKTGALTALEGIVEISSIDTGTIKRDDHLRSADFFDVVKYPQMKFKMTKFENGIVYGDLTIKDVTKNIAFGFKDGGTIIDPWGKEKSGFRLNTSINRFDFNINYLSKFGDNIFSVDENVRISINVEGYKQ